MANEREWDNAMRVAESAVDEFANALNALGDANWQRSPAPGKWTTAAVALHVCQAYELGRDSVTIGRTMKLRVPQSVARLSRWFILPVILRTQRFPRAAAPNEVRPSSTEAESLTRDAATARLRASAREASLALRNATRVRRKARVQHAYFGTLNLYTALRLLTAHTRHHARLLAAHAK